MVKLREVYETLHIANAAKSDCLPDWNWISDTNRWTGFHLWFVVSGGAHICVEQEEYHLAPGDFFLFDLSRNHYCTHDPQNPLSVYSVYFHLDADTMRALCPPPFSPQKSAGHLALNCALHERLLQMDAAPDADRNVWFLPILHQFFAASPCGTTRQCTPEDTFIAKACRDIDNHPEREFRIDDICKQIGYSKNHFIRLFKAQTGKTPYEYYLERRTERAKQLILYSNLSYADIASQLGYADGSHFVKQFTKRVGMSPRQYRRTD